MTNNSQLPSQNEEPALKLIADIARALVDDGDSVHVNCFKDADTITLNLHVAPGDVGKVIGKQGRTARSLRTILSAAGMKFRRRYALNIEEKGLSSFYDE